MISNKAKKGLFLFIILITLLLVYMLWGIQNRLPYINKIDDVSLQSVYMNDYTFDNNTVKIVVFIYTNCPDICPMTMYDLAKIQSKLKENELFGETVEMVTITLDPKHDTKEVLRNYADNFNVDSNGWYILRGSVSETNKVAEQFEMVYEKDDSGFVTHSTKMYIVDRENNIRSIHDMAIGSKKVNIDGILVNINRLLNE